MRTIIKSLLDNDLYKFSMQYAVMKKFLDVKVKYTFIDRDNTVYPKQFAEKIKNAINLMTYLNLTSKEEDFLKTISYFPEWYVNFLRGYQYDPNEVIVTQDENDHLKITIEGYWYSTILWEVPILAIISELYYEQTNQLPTINIERDLSKLKEMEAHNAYFSEFGTRRRYSWNVQDTLVRLYKENANHCFVGTSNVYLAYKYGVKPIGTMAHEWIMAHAAMFGYQLSNKLAFENWVDVYNGNLGIALSDTFTTEVFLHSFDMKFAKLFDGVRQDSGDPYQFTIKIIDHYKKLGIDPMTKTIIFSDALNIKKATEIKEFCTGAIKSSFGIGTHLTNDVGVTPRNIVIKLSDVFINDKWNPIVKLSDSSGKHTGHPDEVKLCKQILRIK